MLTLASAQRLVSGSFASAGSVVGEGQLVIGVGAESADSANQYNVFVRFNFGEK